MPVSIIQHCVASHGQNRRDGRWRVAIADSDRRGPCLQRSTGQHSPSPHPSLDAVDRSRQVQCTRPPSSRQPNPTTMPNPAIHPSRRDVSVDLDSQQRALCLGRRRRLANFVGGSRPPGPCFLDRTTVTQRPSPSMMNSCRAISLRCYAESRL